jgi:hypothetical protein
MCGGGGGGGGGCGGVSNRPVSRPPPIVERPTFSSPESNRPRVDLNAEDRLELGARSVKKTKKPERSVIDRAVDEVKQALPKVGDFIRDAVIGRQPVTEQPPVQSRPNPVVPR